MLIFFFTVERVKGVVKRVIEFEIEAWSLSDAYAVLHNALNCDTNWATRSIHLHKSFMRRVA